MMTDSYGTTWSLTGTEYTAVEFTTGAVVPTRNKANDDLRLVDPRGRLIGRPLFLGVTR
ncbi:hypothetical protein [Mobilicoccus sp.]|uniref:hypothetical protein n=1 Tax=Mobilicoccus sp. TaxID=2034349 RepID=UPI0028AC387F|nr:hypothetical protein [Mobilicoccus sp.]